MRKTLNAGIAAALLLACAGLAPPAFAADTMTTITSLADAENQRINDLLQAYTRCVSQGDRAGFERLLLDTSIPFLGVRGSLPANFGQGLAAVQGYAGFRQSVFESGRKYAQRFYDIHIERDGDLAQASLKFETRLVEQGGGGQGWKILHLLKVGGDWRIASEFYTVDSLPIEKS